MNEIELNDLDNNEREENNEEAKEKNFVGGYNENNVIDNLRSGPQRDNRRPGAK